VELTVAVNPVFLETFATFWTELCDAFLARGIRLDVLNKSRAEADGIQAVAGSDVAADRWFADYPDADTFAHGVLHTRTGTVGAYAGTPELDRLIEEGRTEMDPAVRHPIYRRVEETLERNALLLPLFHEQVYRFVRPEVEGLSITFFARTVSYEDLRLKA
jgi:ABC-type transport system substrate-binding protein